MRSEVFVSTVAWVTIALTSLAFYCCIVNVFSLYLDFNFWLSASLGASWKEFTAEKAESLLIVSNFMGFLSLYFAAFLVAGVAVLERRNWGRILFISLSACSIFFLLVGIVSFFVLIYRHEYVEGLGQLSSTQKFRFVAFGIPSLLFAWTLYRVSLKMSLESVINRFQ